MKRRNLWGLVSCSLFLATCLLLVSADAQGNRQVEKATYPLGTPVLWLEPADIASRNLYLGPGGEAMKPNLSKVTVVEEKESASAAKYRVRDGSGREWMIKVGGETQAEVAASRIVWAVGYFTEVTYLVPRLEIEGRGTFENVRFEARSKGVKRLDEWLWEDNPFLATAEFRGLKVLLALLDNWNLKNENNKMVFVRDDEAGRSELCYIVSDFDLKFDKTGVDPSFWHLLRDKAVKSRFIERIKDNFVEFSYAGKHKERLSGIGVANAKWIGALLSRLSDQQLRDAFRAGNYNADEVQFLARTLRTRINELSRLN